MTTPRNKPAFSLIEIMVSMTLLAVIVVGLLVVFNHTSRALRAVNNTTDVTEGARAVVSFVTRDFAKLAASGFSNTLNFCTSNGPAFALPLPTGGSQYTVLQDVFFLTHENDEWMAIGYFVDRVQSTTGVGTLYRFNAQMNGPFLDSTWFRAWYRDFTNATIDSPDVHHICDGLVHLQITPYDSSGRAYPAGYWTNDLTVGNKWIGFTNNFLPAYLDIEIGILEPESTRKFNSINALDANAANGFLTNQVGKIHLFRQRVAVRNHVQPPPF
jgi:prepilin-type N-terminal cleavage/methylation domain-containing protein